VEAGKFGWRLRAMLPVSRAKKSRRVKTPALSQLAACINFLKRFSACRLLNPSNCAVLANFVTVDIPVLLSSI
jgi:hypothetical protein